MPADAQILFRTETGQKVELESVANALGITAAELMRRIVAERLPDLRRQADEEAAKKNNPPHGVTEDATERAMDSLLRLLAKKGEPVRLYPHDLLGAESRALWMLLGYLWKIDPSPSEQKAAERIIAAVADETTQKGGKGKR